jgi:hypothetical protein
MKEYPIDPLPEEWVRCQYLQGLNRVYDKLSADNEDAKVEKVSSSTASSAQE